MSMRTASLNSQYIILFQSTRDKSIIQHLGTQMFTKNTKFLGDASEDATKIQYGYLLIDLRLDTPKEMRIRSNILPSEQEAAYVPA